MIKQENTPSFKLNDQAVIPMVGLGTWGLTGKEAFLAVKDALELGYRHIDAANTYENHQEIGKAIKEAGVLREDIFLTSKIFINELAQEGIASACDRFLKELDTSYLDLFLMHRPNEEIPIEETLKAMDDLKKAGKIRALGVSNFNMEQLSDALAAGYDIANNQVEFHPSLNERELQNFCESKGVVLTAYSPLGQGQDLDTQVIKEIGLKNNISPAQVILSWHLQQGRVVIPKSKNREHIKENLESLKIELDKEDLDKIDAIG